jgi:hypothetical protein
MKKLLAICAVLALVLAFSGPARAAWYYFSFSEEDLYNHNTSSDTRLYNQDAPRRHHTTWKSDVQTTDSNQGNTSLYQSISGTNGWFQSATYDNWLGFGPIDNNSNPFGITEVQTWGAGWPNVRLAYNERFRVSAGSAAWKILATPPDWTGLIVDNPWPDDGSATPLDQYFIQWRADSYDDRILESTAGGVEDYLFVFAVNIDDTFGEYATTQEPSPDGDPFESDGSLRIWFGGQVVDPDNDYSVLEEGFDGVMELGPMPVYSCSGFDPPMDKTVNVKKKNRVLPLKMVLVESSGTEVTDQDIVARPVVEVEYSAGAFPTDQEGEDFLSSGKGDGGNEFVFSGTSWDFNLSSRNFRGAGTYTITAESGDLGEYVIDPTCTAIFVVND